VKRERQKQKVQGFTMQPTGYIFGNELALAT
jgi:hypothetical protein